MKTKTLLSTFLFLLLSFATTWAETVDLSTVTTDKSLQDGDVVTGTLGANVKISIANNATVTLNGVTINGVNDENYKWAGITCEGNCNIILAENTTNNVKNFYSGFSCIYVPVGSTLTISGTGILNVRNENVGGAGIGGGSGINCGNIVITGGTINARGKRGAAGIGGGSGGNAGNIVITGGSIINAGGGSGSAGIGGGREGSVGNIVITGGSIINAVGGTDAAGIGGGREGNVENIEISGDETEVTASAGADAPYSIGRGKDGSRTGTITIHGIETSDIEDEVFTYTTYTNKKSLTYTIASIPDQTYMGSAICPNVVVKDGETQLVAGVDYWIQCSDNISAGSAQMTITGMHNYEGLIRKTFKIKPKEITIAWREQTSFVYNGTEQAPTATAGGLVNGDKCTITVSGAKDVGSHTAKATALSNKNYKLPTDNLEKPFEITPKEISVVWGELTLVYNGTEQAPTATAEGLVNGDKCTITVSGAKDVGSHTAKAVDLSNKNYKLPTENLEKPFEITQREITISWGEQASFIYDGAEHIPTATVEGVLDGDNCVTVTGAQKNVGKHTATATVECGDKDYYKLPTENLEKPFEITQREITISWGEQTSFTYDGAEHIPTATVEGVLDGDNCVSVTGAQKNVGKYTATATVECGDKDYYKLPTENLEKSFEITQREITISWGEQTSFTYDGVEHIPTATVEGVLDGDNCKLTVTGAQKNVGSHTATATIECDDKDYYKLPTENFEKPFEITQREITIAWGEQTSFAYDGAEHIPTATVKGVLDGDNCELTVTGAQKNVGKHTVTVTVECGDKGYYKLPENAGTPFEITPKEISIVWGEQISFVYNGSEQFPTAMAEGLVNDDECMITVSGAKDVGSHTAKAIDLSNSNYKLPSENLAKSFEITPKEISIAWEEQTLFFYNGAEQAPTATAEGLVNGDECTIIVSGAEKQVGTYTATAIALSNSNYKLPTENLEKQFEIYISKTTKLDNLSENYVAQNGEMLTGTLRYKHKISIADGATVILNGVKIDGEDDQNYIWAGITCEGDCNIILAENSVNTVKGFYHGYPGILVLKDKTLTISGTGSLYASSNGKGAGIGGSTYGLIGNIVIRGGNITASGGEGAAGIGCGNTKESFERPENIDSFESFGSITISGGIITAIGGEGAAGIGGGRKGEIGNITISGGTVTATGGKNAAGIGSGQDGAFDNITISGTDTKVTATKGEDASYSIGIGKDGSRTGKITIGGVETSDIEINEFDYSKWKPLTSTDITIADITDQTYTGSAICPNVVVKDGETTLEFGVDCTVECTDNISAGTAKMTITGMGYYAGSISKTFKITPKVTRYAAIQVFEDENGKRAEIAGEYDGPDAVNITEDIKNVAVTFNRTFKQSGFATIVLPFDYDANDLEGVKSIIEFTGMRRKANGDTTVGMSYVWCNKDVQDSLEELATAAKKKCLEENGENCEDLGKFEHCNEQDYYANAGKMVAYTPYMVQMGTANISFKSNVTLKKTITPEARVGDWVFRGTLESHVWTDDETKDGKIWAFAGKVQQSAKYVGQFVKLGGGASATALKAYMICEPKQQNPVQQVRKYVYNAYPTSSSGDRVFAPVSRLAAANPPALAGVETSSLESLDVVIVSRDQNKSEERTTIIGSKGKRTGEIRMNRNRGMFDLKGRRVNESKKAKGVYYKR